MEFSNLGLLPGPDQNGEASNCKEGGSAVFGGEAIVPYSGDGQYEIDQAQPSSLGFLQGTS